MISCSPSRPRWFQLSRSSRAASQPLPINCAVWGRCCLFSEGQDEMTPHMSSIYCFSEQGKPKCLSDHFIYLLSCFLGKSLFFSTYMCACEPVWGRRVCVCVFRRWKKNFLLSASDVTNLLWQGWLYIYSWWERRLHQSSRFERDRPAPMSTCSGRTAELWLSRELAVNFSHSPRSPRMLELFNLPRLAGVPAISLVQRLGFFLINLLFPAAGVSKFSSC